MRRAPVVTAVMVPENMNNELSRMVKNGLLFVNLAIIFVSLYGVSSSVNFMWLATVQLVPSILTSRRRTLIAPTPHGVLAESAGRVYSLWSATRLKVAISAYQSSLIPISAA